MPDKPADESKHTLAIRDNEILDFGENEDLFKRVSEIFQAQQEELTTLRAATADDRIAKLEAEVERLRPLADDGTAYRAAVIEETLAEGVRAQGNSFPKETQRGLLEKASIADIIKIRDGYKAVGDANLKGGRQTVDETQPPATVKTTIPAAAYAV
jgi:hypothetical protein